MSATGEEERKRPRDRVGGPGAKPVGSAFGTNPPRLPRREGASDTPAWHSTKKKAPGRGRKWGCEGTKPRGRVAVRKGRGALL